jgi:hypothetical protein
MQMSGFSQLEMSGSRHRGLLWGALPARSLAAPRRFNEARHRPETWAFVAWVRTELARNRASLPLA